LLIYKNYLNLKLCSVIQYNLEFASLESSTFWTKIYLTKQDAHCSTEVKVHSLQVIETRRGNGEEV